MHDKTVRKGIYVSVQIVTWYFSCHASKEQVV